MRFKTIIFDWAGTTVDYGCLAPVTAFQAAFAAQGIHLTEKAIRQPMGKLKRDHINDLLQMNSVQQQWHERYGKDPSDEDITVIYQDFEKFLMQDLAANSTLKPETAMVMPKLQAAGFNIGTTTGYTREMMQIVADSAGKAGYRPDKIVTPDDVGQRGRPYPYMIYHNMAYFGNRSVDEVMKVGDTVADILEGKNAGVFTVGVIEGSSEMGLSQAEYAACSAAERHQRIEEVSQTFYQAGADLCVLDLNQLADYLLTGNSFAEPLLTGERNW